MALAGSGFLVEGEMTRKSGPKPRAVSALHLQPNQSLAGRNRLAGGAQESVD